MNLATATSPTATPTPEPWWRRAGTLVLAGGIVMGLALGIRHVMGFFMIPVTLDRGWARDTFAFAIAVQNLSWGLAQPFTGMAADRFGSAKVIAAGLVIYALGLVLMARAASPAAFIWGAGVVIGIGLAGSAFGLVYGALSKLIAPERRSWALGLAGAVGGLAQFAMVPSVQALLLAWGWRGSLLVLAVVMLLAMPLVLPLSGRAAPGAASEAATAMPMSAAIREAFAHRGFWMLNAGFLACGFQLAFIATHLPAYLLDKGLRASDAVTALALIALSNVIGTYCFGLLGGRHRRKYLLAGVYVLRTAAMAMFVLLPLSPLSAFVFAAVMGFLWLGTLPLTNGLVAQVFGVRYIGTLFGFVFLGHQIGSFLGVWLGGYVFAATQSYDLIWLVAMVLGVAAAALHWPIDDREIVRLRIVGARLGARA